jgi:hypothetical protein
MLSGSETLLEAFASVIRSSRIDYEKPAVFVFLGLAIWFSKTEHLKLLFSCLSLPLKGAAFYLDFLPLVNFAYSTFPANRFADPPNF